LKTILLKNSDILSEIIIKNFRADFIHKRRRELKDKRRLDIAGNLIDTKTDAVTYVRKEAQKLIQFGDPYPILPKTDILRKAKSEIQEKRLGITGKLLIYTCISILNNNNNNIHTYIHTRARLCVCVCVCVLYIMYIVYRINTNFFLYSKFLGSLPINNLVDAHNTTHAGIIKKVGALPFFCYYWTKEQKLFYKLNLKRDDSFMTIDATGSIAKKNTI